MNAKRNSNKIPRAQAFAKKQKNHVRQDVGSKKARSFTQKVHSTEDEVFFEIAELWLSFDAEGGVFPKPFPKVGVGLGSDVGQQCILALENPTTQTINGVPADMRRNCRELLKMSLERPHFSNRLHLLCTSASKGLGKTSVLYFNMHWFLQDTQGIAVVVTFNDDQGGLWKGKGAVACAEDLLQGLAVRILHRVLAHYTNSDFADKQFGVGLNSKITKLVANLQNPLDSALRLLPRLLGAPPDTKVLLCVDELSKAELESTPTGQVPFTSSRMLGLLTGSYLDKIPTLFLAVSTYGAVDLVKLSTGSNRPLLLQSLEPLWHEDGFNSQSIPLLPALLQPFYDKTMRKCLPFDMKSKRLYADISGWLTLPAGHPRRVEGLFRELRKGDELLKDHVTAISTASSRQTKQVAGVEFVAALTKWLGRERRNAIVRSIIASVGLPQDGFVSLINLPAEEVNELSIDEKSQAVAIAVEYLAKDTACAFQMPGNKDAAAAHANSLKGTVNGHCHFLRKANTNDVHAFIPLPVLDRLPSADNLLPCGQALVGLRDALKGFRKNAEKNEQGKDLERVIALHDASNIAAVVSWIATMIIFSVLNIFFYEKNVSYNH